MTTTERAMRMTNAQARAHAHQLLGHFSAAPCLDGYRHRQDCANVVAELLHANVKLCDAEQTASDAVKAAHAERDSWRERALAAEGREKVEAACALRCATAAVAKDGEVTALRARLNEAKRLRSFLDRLLTMVESFARDSWDRAPTPKSESIAFTANEAGDIKALRAFLAAPAAGEPAKEAGCPCERVTPCDPRCTCVQPASSRGCDRCRKYGSPGLRPEVLVFARLMEEKLRENDHKGGWKESPLDYLLRRLAEERKELDIAVQRYRTYRMTAEERINVGREAADVANFAMMLADVCGALALTPPASLPCQPGRPDSEPAASPPLTCETCGHRPHAGRPCTATADEGHTDNHFAICGCHGTGKRDTGTPAPPPPIQICTCGCPSDMHLNSPGELGPCGGVSADGDYCKCPGFSRDTGTPPGAPCDKRYGNYGSYGNETRNCKWPAGHDGACGPGVRRGTPGAGGS